MWKVRVGGGPHGANVGFLTPSGMPKAWYWASLGPQENVIDSAGKLPTENQSSGGSAILAEVGSQLSGGAWQPRVHPTPESHFSKPACCLWRLLNLQLRQKDFPKLPLDNQHWRLWPYHVEIVFLKSETNFEKFFSQHFCVSNTVFLTVNTNKAVNKCRCRYLLEKTKKA